MHKLLHRKRRCRIARRIDIVYVNRGKLTALIVQVEVGITGGIVRVCCISISITAIQSDTIEETSRQFAYYQRIMMMVVFA